MRLLSNALRFFDRGVGIAPEFQSRIFERFAQADASDTRRADGVGLSLAIVKQFATAIGARVGFDTTPGQGTAFHLDLPPAEPGGSSDAAASASHI
jgi:signal transduction histidine kinase